MEKETKTNLDSEVLLSIADYLSNHGFAKMAEDLKSEAKVKDEKAAEDKEDCFPQPLKPNPLNPLLTAFVGPKFTPSPILKGGEGPGVLIEPNVLILHNMDRRTKEDDVKRFFEAAGVVPKGISLSVTLPIRNTSSVEKSGCVDKILTQKAWVVFHSWEDTKKAMGLYGKLMEVRGAKRTMEEMERNAVIGRRVFMNFAGNNLRTVCVAGCKRNVDGSKEPLDKASIRKIVSEKSGIEIISSFSPEKITTFEYYLVRISDDVEEKLKEEGGKLVIGAGNCGVIVRVANMKPELLALFH